MTIIYRNNMAGVLVSPLTPTSNSISLLGAIPDIPAGSSELWVIQEGSSAEIVEVSGFTSVAGVATGALVRRGVRTPQRAWGVGATATTSMASFDTTLLIETINAKLSKLAAHPPTRSPRTSYGSEFEIIIPAGSPKDAAGRYPVDFRGFSVEDFPYLLYYHSMSFTGLTILLPAIDFNTTAFVCIMELGYGISYIQTADGTLHKYINHNRGIAFIHKMGYIDYAYR